MQNKENSSIIVPFHDYILSLEPKEPKKVKKLFFKMQKEINHRNNGNMSE